MKKFFKWLSIILGTIIGLFVALIIALPILIDPNDFKNEITASVKKHTGRTLTIEGDIQLSVFPWIGLQLGKTQLSNASGFGQQPMLQLENIKLGVKLLPLLRQELQTDETTLDGLQLYLQRNANGKTNWDDLVNTSQPAALKNTPAKSKATTPAPLAAFAIGGLQLKNASVTWDDKLTKQRWQITNLDLSSDAIQWGKTFPIKLSLSVEAKHLQARSGLKLASNITLYKDKRIQLDKLKLAQQIWHPQLPKAPLDLTATLQQLQINSEKQTLTLEKLQLNNAGLTLQASANVNQLFDAPQYQASINIPEFDPRQLATEHNIGLPKDLPKTAFTKLQTQLTLKGNANSITINKISLQLDNSHLTGNASLPAFSPLKYRYQLALDTFDVDAYQPASTKKPVAATPAAGAAAATQLPMALLRSLDIQGQLSLGQLKASNLVIKNIKTQLKAHKGQLRLHPLRAQLYAGTYSGDLQLNAKGKHPVLSTNEHIKGIALGPLLKDLIGDDKLHGTTNLQAKLTTRGTDLMNMRQQLNGSISADMKDGYLKGVDIDYAERKLRAKIKRQPAPAKPTKPQTGFSKLVANFDLHQGIAKTKTLTAQLPHARMNGTGNIDLVQERLNMILNFKFSSKVQGQSGKAYDELNRVSLPVHLRGPFTKLDYDIDFDAALKSILKQKLNKQKSEAKAKYEQKLKDEKQKLKEKLNQKADDFLKKYFKR